MLRKHIAVDLGTANTLVFVQSQGIVINEPSVVAVDTINERVIAVGKEAKDYIGKTPQRISTIRPLRDGVIADFDAAQALIATFLKKVIGSWPIKPDVVICVPTNITDVERRAVAEAATKAGARNVKLIEEPVAAAVGAGLPVLDPVGSMVVDIGGGTTDIAVITLGSMACSTSLKLAGDALTAAVQRFVQEKYQIVVGENMAERIKIALGSVAPLPVPLSFEVSGKDLATASPRTIGLPTHHRKACQRGHGDTGSHSARIGGRHHAPRHVADRGRSLAERLCRPYHQGYTHSRVCGFRSADHGTARRGHHTGRSRKVQGFIDRVLTRGPRCFQRQPVWIAQSNAGLNKSGNVSVIPSSSSRSRKCPSGNETGGKPPGSSAMNSVSETVSPAGLKAAETAPPEGTLDRPNVSRTARSTASSLASPERTNVSAEMSHVSMPSSDIRLRTNALPRLSHRTAQTAFLRKGKASEEGAISRGRSHSSTYSINGSSFSHGSGTIV